jgi:hypothetical protein
VLNLQEIYTIATRQNQACVLIDNQIKAELATVATPGSNNPEIVEFDEIKDVEMT